MKNKTCNAYIFNSTLQKILSNESLETKIWAVQIALDISIKFSKSRGEAEGTGVVFYRKLLFQLYKEKHFPNR